MNPKQIYVNDEPRKIEADATLHALLLELALAERKGIAVAVNDEIAPRERWGERALAPGDRVLILQATQGG
ncbi:MAG: sulfur carrier protein ThiS [Spirochaetes bacterium]|nr:sulfur carrier protein ThiS [Spirochaetota bacterium]